MCVCVCRCKCLVRLSYTLCLMSEDDRKHSPGEAGQAGVGGSGCW